MKKLLLKAKISTVMRNQINSWKYSVLFIYVVILPWNPSTVKIIYTYHGELTDNSSSRSSTKQTTYNCTGPGSIVHKIPRIVKVPYAVCL